MLVSTLLFYGIENRKVAWLLAAVIATPAFFLGGLLGRSALRSFAVKDPLGFGSSSSQQVVDLAAVPRFASAIDSMERLEVTGGWIGGGLVVDRGGITWSPTLLSRRFRRVPVMAVAWSDVARVEVRRVSGVGRPAFVGVHLEDGSTWNLNASGRDRLRRALGSMHELGAYVEADVPSSQGTRPHAVGERITGRSDRPTGSSRCRGTSCGQVAT